MEKEPIPTRLDVFYSLVKNRFQYVTVRGTFSNFGIRKIRGGNQKGTFNTIVLSPVFINDIQVDHMHLTIRGKMEKRCQHLQPGDIVSYQGKLRLYDGAKIKVDAGVRQFVIHPRT